MVGICSIPDCCKPAYSRTWCRQHYTQWQRNGDPLVFKRGGKPARGVCAVDRCGEPHKARGYCSAHYAQWLRTGSPDSDDTPDGAPAAWIDAHVEHVGEACLIWPFATNTDGYGVISAGGHRLRVSRAICELAHGPPPTPDHEAAHSCGRGHEGCVHPGHLRWATHAENMADRLEHGTHNRGERHGMARLTEADVRLIRGLKDSVSAADLAKQFGVHPTHIRSIHRRKSWGWLS